MEETYQLIEGSPTLHDLDAEIGFLWCPLGYSERLNEPGILVSRLDDGSYDVRLGIGLDSPVRFAIRDLEWSWMDMVMDETVELTFPDDMALNDWIASETTATGAAWARCFNPYCGPDEKTLNTSEIIDTLKRFESPSYLVRGPIENIESLPVGYYWSPDAVDPDPSYNGYLLNVFAGFDGHGFPAKSFELFGGVTLNDVPSFGCDDGWDGSCLTASPPASSPMTWIPSNRSSRAVPPGSSAFPLTAQRRPRVSMMWSRQYRHIGQTPKGHSGSQSPGVSQSACSRARGPRRQRPPAVPISALGPISRRTI